MKEDDADEYFDYSELDYYRKTLNFEVMSRLLYLQKAQQMPNGKMKDSYF